MNEQLKKLAEQAELNLELQSLKVEKFAELIVRECVSVAMEQYDDTLFWGGVRGVLKHFGVEE